jgi:hypothetical protein
MTSSSGNTRSRLRAISVDEIEAIDPRSLRITVRPEGAPR